MGNFWRFQNFMYWFWPYFGKNGGNYSRGDIFQGRILIKKWHLINYLSVMLFFTIFPHFFQVCQQCHDWNAPQNNHSGQISGSTKRLYLVVTCKNPQYRTFKVRIKAFFFTWGIFQWLRGHEEGQVVKNACPCSAFKILKQGQIVVSAFIWLCF